MRSLDIIQKSIDYIEDNLKVEITVQELADNANFSLFHYYRLFQAAVGMPVMQYIVRRKLLHAVFEISCAEKMIDVALKYGFETHAGFYKAFKREFGHTPAQFIKKHKVNKPHKINLFKEEHIMITHKRISKILKNWNLENEAITDIFYDVNGIHNDNVFYVGEKYVIKVSANIGKLKSTNDISKSLEKNGFFAATPIKTTDGKDIVEDDELYFILINRLQGECLKANDMYEGDYKSKARFVGEIIGQLSLALEKIDVIVNDVNIYENVKNWALPKTKDLLYLPQTICNDYLETFGGLYDDLPKQIIHRDPNPGNIIVANDKWGFIDFELSERNVRLYDPCYATSAILSESFDENDIKKLSKWIDIYKNIIYGYDTVAKLSDAERKAVPYVFLSNMFVCFAWFSEQEKYKELFEISKKMTKWAVENFNKLLIE